MPQTRDSFRHHPDLRALIQPAESSFFRDFEPAQVDATMAAQGLGTEWRTSDAERERNRRETLARRPPGDLWVFAYGSLMWDPALVFDAVRRAWLPGYRREMCLRDTLGGRGTVEAPGLMAGLVADDPETDCEGLAFRVAEERVDHETTILWRREMIVPAYRAVFVPVALGGATVRALTFVADPAAPMVRLDLTPDEQMRMLATGSGFLGSAFDYIANLVAHFEALGVHDAHLAALHDGARALARAP